MSNNQTTKLLAELRDPRWRGHNQHLRSWSDLHRLHDRAAAAIERLRAKDLAWASAATYGDGGMVTPEGLTAYLRGLIRLNEQLTNRAAKDVRHV